MRSRSEVIEQAKREIRADVAAEIVPADVRSFSELHDYVDANEYGGGLGAWASGDVAEDIRFWNGVQTELDAWILAKGHQT